MQFAWLIRGLRTGIVTTRYPREPETLPTGFRGSPVLDATRCRAADGCDACVQACLPRAITLETRGRGDTGTRGGDGFAVSPPRRVPALGEMGGGARFELNYGACIMCGLCVAACPGAAMSMTTDYELAVRHPEDLIFTTTLTWGGAHGESTDSRDSN